MPNVEWLLLSLGVLVVAAVLAVFLHERIQGLEKRLNRLEGREPAEDDDGAPVDAAFAERRASKHDHRA